MSYPDVIYITNNPYGGSQSILGDIHIGGVFYGNVDGYLTTASASDYVTIASASSYITSDSAFSTYQTIASASLTYQTLSNLDTDSSLSSNSDTLYSSQKATKTYVDASVTGLLNDRGNWDASVNLFPSAGGSGVGGDIMKGDIWYVSVDGTLGGTSVVVGNNFRAVVDSPGQVSSNWNILNMGLGYIPENIANKGISNGYAPLNSSGKVPSSNISYDTVFTHGFNSQQINLTTGPRWCVFSNLFTLSATVLTTSPTYPSNFRLSVVPKTGTITKAKISWFINFGTATQSQTLDFRNDTTDTTYTVTTSLQIGPNNSGSSKTYTVSGLSIPVTEDDVVFSSLYSPQVTSGTVLSGVVFMVDYIIS